MTPAIPVKLKLPRSVTNRVHFFAVRLRLVGASHLVFLPCLTRRPPTERCTVNITVAGRLSLTETVVPNRFACCFLAVVAEGPLPCAENTLGFALRLLAAGNPNSGASRGIVSTPEPGPLVVVPSPPPEVEPELLPELKPEVLPEEPVVLPDVSPEVEPEVLPDVEPELPDVVPEVVPDVPDVEPELPDVLPDVSPEVEPEVLPDVEPELPDVVPEVVPPVVVPTVGQGIGLPGAVALVVTKQSTSPWWDAPTAKNES